MINPRTSVQLLLRIKVMRLTSTNCCLPHPNFASNARTTSGTYLNHSESMLARSRPAEYKKCMSQWPMVLSEGIWPSGWMPCSKQKSSQHLGQLHTHDFKEKSWNHGKKVPKSRKRTMAKGVPVENKWEWWFLPVREVPWVTCWSVWGFIATRDMCALVNMMASTSKKCHSMSLAFSPPSSHGIQHVQRVQTSGAFPIWTPPCGSEVTAIHSRFKTITIRSSSSRMCVGKGQCLKM